MNYEEAKFNVCCFFTALSLEEIRIQSLQIDDFIRKITLINSDLKHSGVLVGKYTNIRKKKWKYEDGFQKIITAIDDDVPELSYFVSDSKFTIDNAPEILINIHTSRKSAKSIINLKLSNSEKTSSFVLLALSSKFSIESSFNGFYQLFGQLKGIKGCFFNDVDYSLNSGSSIEWAYNNIPAKLRGGNLEDWNEETGKMF